MPDPSSRKLVIASGSSFESTERGLIIESPADIVLTGPLAAPLLRVTSTHGSVALSGELVLEEVSAHQGSVALGGRVVVDSVTAGGPMLLDGQVRAKTLHAKGPLTLRGAVEAIEAVSEDSVHVEGRVSAERLRAPLVRVGSGECTAKAIQGLRTVHLGAARLTVEIVIAPQVEVTPQATGRVNVIECRNELAPNGLKGGFGLAEYAEFTGIDADDFLRRRGLSPLGAVAPELAPVPGSAASQGLDLSEDLITLNSENEEPEASQQDIREADLEPVEHSEELDLDDPAALARPHDEFQAQLLDTVDQIASSYASAEEPPSITALRELVQSRQYDRVRDQLTPLWNDLIRYHQKRNLRVAHKVTIKFNALNTLVRKGG